jgi:formate dehydrogenase subunit delta
MDSENLVHMANRIGDFFQAMPDRSEAKLGIAGHIRTYWEPRMRECLLDHIDREHAHGLSPLVREAIEEQRSHLKPGSSEPNSTYIRKGSGNDAG